MSFTLRGVQGSPEVSQHYVLRISSPLRDICGGSSFEHCCFEGIGGSGFTNSWLRLAIFRI